MKKKYLLMTTLIFLSQLTSPINTLATIENSQEYKVANNSDSEAIDDWMPDKNVQNIVMTALGVPTVNSITKDLMNQLTSFSAEQSTFTSFEGLQYATNLDTLSLVSCQLPSDFKLSFFAENIPKLKTLRISNSGLSNINLSGYITFYNLDTLDFSKNNLSGTLTDFNQFGLGLQLTEFNVADNHLSEDLITDFVPIPAIDAIDKTIKVGDKWEAADNFVSAQDLNGDILNLDQLVVSGEVDTDTPGDYEVVYTRNFGNTWNNYIYKKVMIHVLTDPTLIVKDSTIQVGDSWTAKENFVSATDNYGKDVPLDQVNVSGEVDTDKPGIYPIDYIYSGITKTANIIVEKKTEKTYNVTFNAGKGGSLMGTTTIKVPEGTNISDIPTIVVDESDVEDIFFLDWYKDGEIVNPQEATITKDTTFTAKFGAAVYRLYNKNNGDHLLTKNKNEKNDIAAAGWILETNDSNPYGRAAFYVPVKDDSKGKKQVYRIYNPNSGEHFYSTNKAECDAAVKSGWRHETNEDYTWVSDGDVKMYREFNPDVNTAGSHNFTTNKDEHEGVVKAGWRDEAKDTSLWKALKAGF